MLAVMTTDMAAPRPLRVLAWLGGLAAAIALLGMAGTGPLAAPPLDPATWSAWAGQREPVVIVVAFLRLLTLMLAWYLLGATVINVAARLLASTRLVTLADLLTLPSVRRVLQGALGLGFATSAALGSAATTPSAVPVGSTFVAVQITSDAVEMVPLSDEDAVMLPVPAPAPRTSQAPQERIWTVQPGEHFWSIAEDVLRTTWGRPPTDAETTPYWEQLIEVNRDRLADRSNPDFIRPGDTFVVPRPPRQESARD